MNNDGQSEELLAQWEQEAKSTAYRSRVGSVHRINSELWSVMVWYAPGAPATELNDGFGYLWRQYGVRTNKHGKQSQYVIKSTASASFPLNPTREDMLRFLGRVANDWELEAR